MLNLRCQLKDAPQLKSNTFHQIVKENFFKIIDYSVCALKKIQLREGVAAILHDRQKSLQLLCQIAKLCYLQTKSKDSVLRVWILFGPLRVVVQTLNTISQNSAGVFWESCGLSFAPCIQHLV